MESAQDLPGITVTNTNELTFLFLYKFRFETKNIDCFHIPEYLVQMGSEHQVSMVISGTQLVLSLLLLSFFQPVNGAMTALDFHSDVTFTCLFIPLLTPWLLIWNVNIC